jgi:hypothetical protein
VADSLCAVVGVQDNHRRRKPNSPGGSSQLDFGPPAIFKRLLVHPLQLSGLVSKRGRRELALDLVDIGSCAAELVLFSIVAVATALLAIVVTPYIPADLSTKIGAERMATDPRVISPRC